MNTKISADQILRVIDSALDNDNGLPTVAKALRLETKLVAKIGRAEVDKILAGADVPAKCYRVKDIGHKMKILNLALVQVDKQQPAAAPAPAPMKMLSDYIAEANKAKPAPAIEQPKLTGMDAVRASIRADIDRERIKFELPVRQMSAPATDAGRPSRQQLNAVYVAVKDEPLPANLSDTEAFVQTEKACWQSHQRIPGMRTDAELSETYWRTDKPKGLGLAILAMRRDRIEKILK